MIALANDPHLPFLPEKKPVSVLVLAENDLLRRLYRRLLGASGMHVLEASDNLTAWRMLGGDNPPDLIFCDISTLNGPGERLLALAGAPWWPRFVVAGNQPILDNIKRNKPTLTPIAKPFTFDQLLATIDAALHTVQRQLARRLFFLDN